MRYPGRHRHESLVRAVGLLLSLSIFLTGLILVQRKNDRTSQASTLPSPVSSVTAPRPAPTTAVSIVKLIDGATGRPLSGQSIAILVTLPCLENKFCPAATPLVASADQEGRITVNQSVLLGQPKLYAAGYKLDAYFAFLDPNRPSELTLYKTIPGYKSTFDITIDEVVIGLSPVK